LSTQQETQGQTQSQTKPQSQQYSYKYVFKYQSSAEYGRGLPPTLRDMATLMLAHHKLMNDKKSPGTFEYAWREIHAAVRDKSKKASLARRHSKQRQYWKQKSLAMTDEQRESRIEKQRLRRKRKREKEEEEKKQQDDESKRARTNM